MKTADRNKVTDCYVNGTSRSGIRILGGSQNRLQGNTVVNTGEFDTSNWAGIRIEGSTGYATDDNHIIGTALIDDRTATHPAGTGNMTFGIQITATNSPTGNTIFDYYTSGLASADLSDGGTSTVEAQISDIGGAGATTWAGLTDTDDTGLEASFAGQVPVFREDGKLHVTNKAGTARNTGATVDSTWGYGVNTVSGGGTVTHIIPTLLDIEFFTIILTDDTTTLIMDDDGTTTIANNPPGGIIGEGTVVQCRRISADAWIYLNGGNPAGGDVTKVGTPVNNELAVWTGDGTLEGEALVTWDGSELVVTGDIRVISGNLDAGDGHVRNQQGILGVNENFVIDFDDVHADAVNYFEVLNAILTGHPELRAIGDDANIDIRLVPKGTGNVDTQGRDIVLGAGNVQLDVGALVDGRDVSVDGAKLDLILGTNTGDQTAGDIETLLDPDWSTLTDGINSAADALHRHTAVISSTITVGARLKIDYDNEAGGPFQVDETITGATSGATANIDVLDDQGTTGTLDISQVTGQFEENEEIEGGTSGCTADVDWDAANEGGVVYGGTELVPGRWYFWNNPEFTPVFPLEMHADGFGLKYDSAALLLAPLTIQPYVTDWETIEAGGGAFYAPTSGGFDYDTEGGSWPITVGETIHGTTFKGVVTFIEDNGSDGTIWYKSGNGHSMANNETVTGQTSGGTCLVDDGGGDFGTVMNMTKCKITGGNPLTFAAFALTALSWYGES